MKTPMQELIEIIKKRQEDDEAMPFMYNDRIIKLAESMLEKEKEVMCEKVKSMQKLYGYAELQMMIDTGMAWLMEGSYGRVAMDALRSGACMLPTSSRKDYYGNIIPSRYQVAEGSAGSYRNTVNFYLNIDDYEY